MADMQDPKDTYPKPLPDIRDMEELNLSIARLQPREVDPERLNERRALTLDALIDGISARLPFMREPEEMREVHQLAMLRHIRGSTSAITWGDALDLFAARGLPVEQVRIWVEQECFRGPINAGPVIVGYPEFRQTIAQQEWLQLEEWKEFRDLLNRSKGAEGTHET